ncbi:hypothetical protein [Acetobacter sp.]|uniref:hypothetical protein n=1 Tax=Acetobacter sp. TaxID=440 RepID=UPI0039E900B2
MDRWGAKYTITFGALVLATGTCLFGWGNEWLAGLGRLMQGAGSAFAFVGAVYLAARGFSRQHLATAVGVTQYAGMMGGHGSVHRGLADPWRAQLAFFLD